ncbi:hypothetical protein [Paenibacillus dendritiformis]|uniref:hypothetical protein n=1 Tax=Paenibacillus dendritiformis TaxID=130049 RepID=UPI001BCBB6BA|nr:hypothetical protein [Paenibacillus dendritiformis]
MYLNGLGLPWGIAAPALSFQRGTAGGWLGMVLVRHVCGGWHLGNSPPNGHPHPNAAGPLPPCLPDSRPELITITACCPAPAHALADRMDGYRLSFNAAWNVSFFETYLKSP